VLLTTVKETSRAGKVDIPVGQVCDIFPAGRLHRQRTI